MYRLKFIAKCAVDIIHMDNIWNMTCKFMLVDLYIYINIYACKSISLLSYPYRAL